MVQPAVLHTRMSLEAFEALPDEKPYLEYVHGEVLQKPVPKTEHWMIAGEIDYLLGGYRRTHGGHSGPEPHVYFFDVDGETIVRVPDVGYWAPGKPVRIIEGNRSLPPTLAVEVRSWHQSTYGQREKCEFMVAHGVDVCWLVDPDARTVEVFEDDEMRTLTDGDRLESRQLPGFVLELRDLFGVIDSGPE